MIHHAEIQGGALRSKIRKMEIRFAGNGKLKIYGALGCTLGKRMKKENRVFFITEQEAWQRGYRPCGHCMKDKYNKWKNGFI